MLIGLQVLVYLIVAYLVLGVVALGALIYQGLGDYELAGEISRFAARATRPSRAWIALWVAWPYVQFGLGERFFNPLLDRIAGVRW